MELLFLMLFYGNDNLIWIKLVNVFDYLSFLYNCIIYEYVYLGMIMIE